MTFQILVLCRANVCRSPLTAATLERLLVAECRSGEVVVRSAGVEAIAGQRACATMAGLARAAGVDTDSLQQHRSTMLNDAMVAEADLVLAADRRVRSQLIRRNGSRIGERVFTLREAGQLAASAAEHAERPGEQGQPRPAGSGASDLSERLRAATAAMHARRGLADLPGTDRFIPLTRPWRPMTLSTQDVPDAHGAPAAPHRVVHRLTLVSTIQLVHAMVIDHQETR